MKKLQNYLTIFFSSAVSNLFIPECEYSNESTRESDPILKAIKKYENHPSIIKIIESRNPNDVFSFKPIDAKGVEIEICSLNKSKVSPNNSIPPKIIQENLDIFIPRIHADFNFSMSSGEFPSNQKNADVSPVFKKGDRPEISNYRPVSILPALSKIFERLLYYQINDYMDSKLSTQQCGFRKDMSAQHC